MTSLASDTLCRLVDPRGHSEKWASDVLIHVGNEDSRERIRKFLETPTARRIIDEWILSERKPDLKMTDMSDVYKASMMGVFSRIQHKKQRELGEDAFRVCFSLNVRKSSELCMEDIFLRASMEEGSEWVKIRDHWLRQVFALPTRKFDVEVLRSLPNALPTPLKGVIRIDEENLKELASQPHTEKVSVRIFLKPLNSSLAWKEILPQADRCGAWVFKQTREHVHTTLKKLGRQDFEILVNCEGPWHLVTYFETALMQETAAALGQGMQLLRNWSDEAFYAKALEMLDQRMDFLRRHLTGRSFDVFLFAGRRSTHLGFHLLQNLWCTYALPNYKGTSSLFAYRVFLGWGWINADGTPACHADCTIGSMPLVGTHAHEGSMVFQALAETADDVFEYPVSSLLWHMNYWLLTGNQAVLSDTMGSPAFVHLLNSLKFPDKFIESWNARHSPKKLQGGISIAEELRNPLVGGMVRQDSGSRQAFIEHYFSSPIKLSIQDGKIAGWVDPHTGEFSKGWKCLASEIGSDDDVVEAHKQGYLGMGTGGYLGEKPWHMAGDQPGLNHRMDLVAKVSCVYQKDKKFYPVKLGDCGTHGKWHHQRPDKFAVSPEVAGTQEEGPIFKRFQRHGEVGMLAGKELYNLGNYPEGGRNVPWKVFDSKNAPAKGLEMNEMWQQQKFDEMWGKYCFIDDIVNINKEDVERKCSLEGSAEQDDWTEPVEDEKDDAQKGDGQKQRRSRDEEGGRRRKCAG